MSVYLLFVFALTSSCLAGPASPPVDGTQPAAAPAVSSVPPQVHNEPVVAQAPVVPAAQNQVKYLYLATKLQSTGVPHFFSN